MANVKHSTDAKASVPPTIERPELVSIANAARSLCVDRRTLKKHLELDGITVSLRGRSWLVSWLDLAQWVNSNYELLRRRAEWGEAIHRERRKAKATTSTVGGV